MSRRTQQVGGFLRGELTDIIRREVKDPRLGFWSLTRVDVPPDLRSARVYVSVLGSDEERAATLAALRSAAGFIRYHLKPRLRMRQIPELEFRDDRSMEHAEEIGRTLREIEAERQAQARRSGASATASAAEPALESERLSASTSKPNPSPVSGSASGSGSGSGSDPGTARERAWQRGTGE